jgi:hypothetical protein
METLEEKLQKINKAIARNSELELQRIKDIESYRLDQTKDKVKCKVCGGSGKITETHFIWSNIKTCTHCWGNGWSDADGGYNRAQSIEFLHNYHQNSLRSKRCELEKEKKIIELLIQSNAEMNNITEKTKENMVLISKEELLKLHANKNCNFKD